MNCKSLYRGSVSFEALNKVSKKVLFAIAAAVFDNVPYLPIKDRLELLTPNPRTLSLICDRYSIDDVEVVEQFPTSVFYKPYECNFRVRFSSNRIYSVYSKPL